MAVSKDVLSPRRSRFAALTGRGAGDSPNGKQFPARTRKTKDAQMPSLNRKLIGTVLEPIVGEVEKGAIRQFARAIGATDPIHTDVEAARAAGYPNVVAPPTFVFCLAQQNSEPTDSLVELGFEVAKPAARRAAFRIPSSRSAPATPSR